MKNQGLKPQYRASIYLAPAAYGEAIDIEQALERCKEYLADMQELRLMRIYRDEEAEIIRVPEHNGKRTPLGVTGNDAWKRLLKDTETSEIEAVLVYAARTVAPSISGLANTISNYFLKCGVRFIDVEAGFDTKSGDAEAYLRQKTSEYRCYVRRRSTSWEDVTE